MKSRKKQDYLNVFEFLNSYIKLEPSYIVFDFEPAILAATKEIYRKTNLCGCIFHFGQSNWRQIQVKGLIKDYKEDVEFKSNVRKLLNLSFVPVTYIFRVFEDERKNQ
jgi:hypothetical protein